jgi:hypothetical protein
VTTVVLDTNELQQDWLCTGLKYQLLSHGGFYPPLQVYVPAVVVEELVANHAREVERLSQAAEISARKLNRLGVTADTQIGQEFDYRGYLITRFDEILGISVLEWPTIAHRDLVARSVTRTPPFNDSGGGYRDALIWSHVVELASTGCHVALVSRDRAFADGDNLIEALAAEVAGLRGSVELVRDFGSWLIAQVPWKVTKLDEAVEISRDAEFGEWLMTSDFLYEIEPLAEDLGFSRSPYKLVIDDVEWAGSTVHLGSKVSPGGATLVEYDITEDVHFEAELAEGTSLDDEWEILPGSFPGRLRVGGTISMIARVGVLYDVDGWSIDELSWRRADGGGPGRAPVEVDPNQLALFTPNG